MISANLDQITDLEHELGTFARQAIPFAIRNTLNAGAFHAQKLARGSIEEDFINRNKHAVKSVLVVKARGLNMRNMMAVMGSTADYMETQEFGGKKQKTGKHGVAIPTSYSAGLGMKAKPRTKLPRKPNKLRNIRLDRRSLRMSRAQRAAATVEAAVEAGDKFIFLDLGEAKGIYRIEGRRNPVIRMVYDVSRPAVDIPAAPWLGPSLEATRGAMPAIHIKSLEFQLRRLGLFRG